MTSSYVWFHWALLSAVFASLTAIFAKIGLEGVNSDFCHDDPDFYYLVRHYLVRALYR
jgi:uncharacterized membrane protein